MFERYNESARRALFFARYEAARCGVRLLGSEHILLGVLRERDSVTAELWRRVGLEPYSIWSRYPAAEIPLDAAAAIPTSEHAKMVMAYAQREAEQLGDAEVTPSHLVLGMLRVRASRAAALLGESGVDYATAAEALRRIREEASSDGP